MSELEELERRGWDALCGPGGADFYSRMMADDGLMVFPGSILGKTDTILAIASAPPWLQYDLADVQVIDAAPDVGIVAYRAMARRDGAAPYSAPMTSTYVRRDGAWVLILHQQSPDA